MWILMNKDNAYLMDSKGNPQDVAAFINNKVTIPKKWIINDTNLIINNNYTTNFSVNSFNKIKLAEVSKHEANKRLTWGVDKEAYKYTNLFKSIFGYNKRFPWCAAFVTYCLRQSGINIPIHCSHYNGYTYALCESFQKLGQANGWYIENTYKNVPEVGDIILFDWHHTYNQIDKDWEDHIGICVSVINDNLILVAEGNKSNKSGVFRRQLKTVEGFVRIPNNARQSDF